MSSMVKNKVSDMFKIDLVKRKESKPKNIHVYMEGEDIERLTKLVDMVPPHKQKTVILKSLQLLDAMVEEINSGSELYIKRKGDDEPVPYKIFS